MNFKRGDKVECLVARSQGHYDLEAGQHCTISAAMTSEGLVSIFGDGGLWWPEYLFEFPKTPPSIIFRTIQQASADGGKTWVEVPK